MNDQDRNPVVAIGIEVGNYDLVREWIESGQLPTLSQLVDHGTLAPMSTVTEISSGSIWPSFATGAEPLRHGQFFTHMQLDGGTYTINKKYADDVPLSPFWAHVAKAGRRCFTFDVAQTMPIREFNGVNLCAWGCEYPAWPRSSWPPRLMQELVAKHGSHPLVDQYRLSIKPETEREYRDFYSKLVTGLDRKGNIALDVLSRERWDFSLIVFPEIHWAMHLLWQTRDKDHPAYDPNVSLPFDDIFLELYQRIDRWLARFLNKVPGATALVFSGSGMGPNYSGWHLLSDVLERLGYADTAKHDAGLLDKVLPIRAWGAQKIRKIEDTVSIRVLEQLKQWVPRSIWDKTTRRLLFAGNRWSESRAFPLPNDYTGAIRLNVRGREPAGTIAPGDEYDRVCERLRAELLTLTNPRTGRPAIHEVIRLDAEYPGQDLGDFPDLIVLWANDAPITALHSPRIGTVAGDFPERRSGAHRNDCFIASNRSLAAVDERTVSITDIAPTVLDLLDVESDVRFDGQSMLHRDRSAQVVRWPVDGMRHSA